MAAVMEAMDIAQEPVIRPADGEVEEDDEEEFESIDKLIALGINAGDVKKLKEAGIYTVRRCHMETKKTLFAIKGLSEAKVEKILEAAEKVSSSVSFVTGAEALAKRDATLYKITTGSDNLDAVLGGGIETMSLTEAYGEFRTGKTQLALTLCVASQLPRQLKGGAGKVAYIDAEGTFRPDRVIPIAERFGLEPKSVLENIIVARAYTHEHQMRMIVGLAAKFAEEPFRLLVIDSVTALFRVDFQGRGELADRQQQLAQMLSRLTKVAEEYNIAVFMTNQVMADPGANAMFVQDAKKPIGGHILAHASTTRLSLRKGKGEQRICKVVDSPSMPEMEATFEITTGGIQDPKE
eukprot:jgi/Mesvir1/14218/Mv09669-RA.1